MDSLDDEDRTLVEREGIVVPLACAGDEVVTGNIDALPLGQSAQMVVELRQVDGLERLVVVLPVLVQRGFLPFDEVVVERN